MTAATRDPRPGSPDRRTREHRVSTPTADPASGWHDAEATAWQIDAVTAFEAFRASAGTGNAGSAPADHDPDR